jgi:hypothetical protein
MNRETLDRWCERGILILVLAILVLGPLAMGAVRPLEFLIIQGLTLGVLMLWGARFWLHSRPHLLWPPICWAVAAFTLYSIGRYLTADIEYVARQELIHAAFPGDGDFILCGLSIPDPLESSLAFPGNPDECWSLGHLHFT